MKSFLSRQLWLNPATYAISLSLVGSLSELSAEDLDWTYDFGSRSITEDWKHNTNNPAVSFGEFVPATAAISYSGNPTFQSTAIHEDSYALGVGDSLSFRLAWSPFNTADSFEGNNDVFQLGAINLDGQSWATTSDRFITGDSFWLSGREIESTTVTALDQWGTQKLNLWLNTDELNNALLDVEEANSLSDGLADTLGLALGLGTIDIETFRQGSDGSVSATFLDIDLGVTLLGDGTFDYDVEIFSYEWTQVGGVASWFNEGSIFGISGNFEHQMDSTDALNAAVGFLVSDSSELGVSTSIYSQAPLAVPEPLGSLLVVVSLAGLGLRRRRG